MRVRSGSVGEIPTEARGESNLSAASLLVVGFSGRRLLAVDRHALVPRWKTSRVAVGHCRESSTARTRSVVILSCSNKLCPVSLEALFLNSKNGYIFQCTNGLSTNTGCVIILAKIFERESY